MKQRPFVIIGTKGGGMYRETERVLYLRRLLIHDRGTSGDDDDKWMYISSAAPLFLMAMRQSLTYSCSCEYNAIESLF